METKAHHVTIGAFILIGVLAAFGFVIWLAKVEIDTDTVQYDIYFEESVSGLSTSSTVLFRGVAVGKIERIRIDPNDPSRVKVTVDILSSTPIREDAVATLAFQGITGVSNIEIEGGSADAPVLKAKEGEHHPVIPSRPSTLQAILGGAPDLINEIGIFVKQLQDMTDDDNRQAVKGILVNLDEITGGMAFRAENINRIIENMDTAMTRMVTLMESLESIAGRTSTLLDSEVPDILANVKATSTSIRTLSDNLNGIVESQGGAVEDFTSNTLPEVGLLVEDIRRLTNSLNRIAARLEEDPREFLFTAPPNEYTPGE